MPLTQQASQSSYLPSIRIDPSYLLARDVTDQDAAVVFGMRRPGLGKNFLRRVRDKQFFTGDADALTAMA
jgi:hypothetical protein